MSFRDRVVTRLQSLPRRARGRLRGGVERQEFEVVSTVGYRISGTLIRPARPGNWSAVVLCPGTNDAGAVFDGWTQPLNAEELARKGYVVVHFDPAGRGASWGEEDYGGPEHQDDLEAVLAFTLGQSDVQEVGVVSISLGLAMAAGALAQTELPVRFLIDWEGPCDREIICAGGDIMVPALGHGLDDDTYWHPREATRHVGALRCPYVRFQSERDHAQPGEFRHAHRMIQAAAAGTLPWFQLNEHGRNEVPQAPDWYPGGRRAANRLLLGWIERMFR
ncbi:MAG: hypothetical protein GY913_13410 [Proteobacteria bacterium]|nr:hypothetical protein [Pseudomonadota bacterium]MCP4917905.1 hypothetical protein [Pseudomonadota bacterium]